MPLFFPPNLPLFQIRATFEDRQRFERRTNKDFDISAPDNRSDLFDRIRVGVAFSYGKALRGELRYQYAHDLIWTAAKNYSTENRDVDLAYAEGDFSGWKLDAGRQKINIGQQRLIGSFDWNNVARSFDALRARKDNWDFFVARIGVASPLPGEARLAAASHKSAVWGDSLYVFKHDRTSGGDVDIHTLDQSIARKFGPVALDAEGAVQFGRSQGKDQRAWALHARGATTLGKVLKPFVELNAASGGSSATENRTFDNLYPTNHGKYGLLDMTGWKNMNQLAVGTDYAPTSKLSLRLSWNAVSLRDSRDAWYGAGGAPNVHAGVALKDPTGLAGRDLGQEIDLDSSYTLSKHASLAAGVGVFQPGHFVEGLTGHRDRQVWGYLQFGARF